MSSIDLIKSSSNTQYDKKEFFSLGLNGKSQETTAKELEQQFDAGDLFNSLLKEIPGVEKVLEGIGLLKIGLETVTKVKNPVGQAAGVLMIAGGIVKATIGIGIAGYKGYEVARDYFSVNSTPKRDSQFHLINPKDLDLSGSRGLDSSSRGNGLLDSSEYNFNDAKKAGNQMQRDFGRDSNFGGLARGQSRGERRTRENFRF